MPKLRSLLVASLIAGLLITNVATLVNVRAHDWLHFALWKTLAVAGDELADRLMRNSSQAKIEEKVKSRTAELHAHNLELSELNRRLDKQLDLSGKQAKTTVVNVHRRLANGVARNVAALPVEAIPYLGIGVTLAVTSLDIYEACATMKDFNALLRMMGQGEENPELCGQRVPSLEDVLASTKALGIVVPQYSGKN